MPQTVAAGLSPGISVDSADTRSRIAEQMMGVYYVVEVLNRSFEYARRAPC